MSLQATLESRSLPADPSKIVGRIGVFEVSNSSGAVYYGTVVGLVFDDGKQITIKFDIGSYVFNITPIKKSERWRAEFDNGVEAGNAEGRFYLSE